jgi:outer membrane protein TolC
MKAIQQKPGILSLFEVCALMLAGVRTGIVRRYSMHLFVVGQDNPEPFLLRRGRAFLGGALAFLLLASASASGAQSQPDPASTAGAPASPVTITLDEAIHRAQSSEANYAAAVAAGRSAALDRNIAYSSLLPSIVYNNQGIYTQPLKPYAKTGSTEPTQIYIANNGIREYLSQGSVSETIGVAGVASARRAQALAAQAAAEQEIARRGLVAAVTALFYGSLSADHKLAVAERARQEAADFLKLTQQREEARESARADVIKAQLEEQSRTREFQDAQVEAEKAHLELGVLLFPDPRTPCTLSADEAAAPLASREDIDAAAAKNNPDLRSALEALRASNADVLGARAAYLPDIGLNYTYGIDAPQFATKGRDGTTNLGYSATVTVNLPVWDWLNTQRKVKQSEIRRESAQVALTATQRQLIARLDEAYSEAAAARDQLASLDLSVSTAAESLRLTRMAYAGGEATVLEVVDAQSAYISAQNAREDGRVRFENARANLQTLTGTM